MQRIFRTLTAASIVLFGLGACESGQKIAAEYGFTGADAGPATGAFATAVDSSKLIYVVPVEGINGPARMVLADAIAAALRDAKQPAILTEKINEMGPTVTGRIVEANERGSVVWVTALWQLLAPYGTAVTEYRQQVVVDAGLWKTGSAELINLLASDAGPKVVAMVHDFVSPMSEQAALPDALAPPGITAAPAPVPMLATPAPEKTPPSAKASAKTSVKVPVKAVAKDRTKNKAAAKALASLARKEAPEPGAKKPAQKTDRPKILMEIPEKTPPAAKRKASLRPVKKVKKGKPVLMPIPAEGPSPVAAAPPPVSWGRPAFLIKAVKGAPGDGNEALTRAMKKALRKSDLTVTEDPRQAKFVIQGKVEISAPSTAANRPESFGRSPPWTVTRSARRCRKTPSRPAALIAPGGGSRTSFPAPRSPESRNCSASKRSNRSGATGTPNFPTGRTCPGCRAGPCRRHDDGIFSPPAETPGRPGFSGNSHLQG